jgi:hypothetical protein
MSDSNSLTMEKLISVFNEFKPLKPFNGFKFLECRFMTEKYDLIKIRRTFRDRFLTRPWMPWINYAWVFGPASPALYYYLFGDNIIAHPEIINKIKIAIGVQHDEK